SRGQARARAVHAPPRTERAHGGDVPAQRLGYGRQRPLRSRPKRAAASRLRAVRSHGRSGRRVRARGGDSRSVPPLRAGADDRRVITLYDADRCPYCARVRIVLAEKGIEYETVVVDLDDRPAWIYDKNPTGRVPVIEEDTFVLPESAVIDDYLNERYPDPPLLP